MGGADGPGHPSGDGLRRTKPATTNDEGEGVAVASRKGRRAGSASMASRAGSGGGGASMAPGRRRELRGAAVSSAAVQEVARVSELRGWPGARRAGELRSQAGVARR